MKTLSQYLLEQCCNFRCGIVLPYQKLENNFCDIPGVHNYAVPEDANVYWRSASGALHSDEDMAIMGAIGESMERYCGAVSNFEIKRIDELGGKDVIRQSEFSLFSEEQYKDPNFAWKKPSAEDSYYCKVHSLYDNGEHYVPQELVGLGSRHSVAAIPSTSTGIAAHTDIYDAILNALLEALERDALSVYWLNSLGGREIPMASRYTDEVRKKGGEVFCFDATQDWNPFPVAMVCGHLPSQGKKRISLGAACRPDYAGAIQKAYFEWIQGCIFAGYYDEYHPNLKIEKNSDVNSFDIHAVYYTKKPSEWEGVPLLKKRSRHSYVETDYMDMGSKDRLKALLDALWRANIRLFYKDLTTVDVKEAGMHVVRVVSPELSLLHGDESVPFLGGRTGDAGWRYKGLLRGAFPNRHPHPLG